MKKLLTLAALVGVSGVANAAPAAATLTGVTTYSANGSAALNISASTATWEVDTATGVATQTGGTFSGKASVGKTLLYTQTMTGGVLSSGAATGTSWGCAEGIFGGIVGAHICGNFTLGGNGTVDSIVGNSGTAVTVVIGGDDVASGDPQTLANSYSNMTLTDLGGGNWKLGNATPAEDPTSGYDFFFTVAAAAVADAVDDDGGDVLEGVGKAINVGANDTNFTDPVTITRTTPDPTKGTAVVTTATGNAADVTITYTASAGQTGTDTFGYQITDGTATETATVTVNILAFGANDDNYATTRGVALTGLTPAVNDTGYDPDTVTITAGACTSGDGAITVTDGNGGPKAGVLVTYTPPANNPASGSSTTLSDSCEYTIGNGDEPDTTANILVTVTNSVPVAADGDASAISTAGVAPAGLTATFTSPGTGGSLGNAGVTAIAAQGTRGTAAVVGNVITYTVTDASFFTGSDTFDYTVTDADGAASDEVDTGTVTVTIADIAPTIADGAITTAADTASAATALTITAGNGSPAQHTLAVTDDGDHGSCTLSAANATGTVTYTPEAGYTGADTCTLTLTDGDGDADTATINVTVEAEDEPTLPGGSSSMDLWSLSLLGSLPLLMRRRRRR
jgi:hypothetical protein